MAAGIGLDMEDFTAVLPSWDDIRLRPLRGYGERFIASVRTVVLSHVRNNSSPFARSRTHPVVATGRQQFGSELRHRSGASMALKSGLAKSSLLHSGGSDSTSEIQITPG